MTTDAGKLTRREAIRNAAWLLGGTIGAGQLSGLLSRSTAAAAAGDPPAFFDDEQFALVEHIAEVMIPETDTPGARAAGVPHFIDRMLSEWASAERQRRYIDGLAVLEDRLQGANGAPFAELDPDRQLDALSAVDAAAFATPASSPFYLELKKMVLFSFYSSETGANGELAYERLPGLYQPCLTVDDDTRSWFHLGFRYGL